MRRPLAILLVLSWIALSGMDALEDLDFGSHITRGVDAAPGRSDPAEPEKQANNILESANSNRARLGDLLKYLDLEYFAHQTFSDAYPATRALRSQKEHCVLLI